MQTLAKHVIQVHVNASAGVQVRSAEEAAAAADELPLDFLKQFIEYARTHCAPRLDAHAGQKLISHYVRLRNPEKDEGSTKRGSHRSAIPITVRQLEAVVRIAESLAKMQLRPFATDVHVDEALRLFRVSTQAAAASGNLAGRSQFCYC